jgi:uncharacterized oxidoreductase
VIVAGRSQEKLQEASRLGFETLTVDLLSAESTEQLAKEVVQKFANLNVVIHNAGIMRTEDIQKKSQKITQDETVTTNLLAPMRLTEALLPHLLKQSSATIMTVTSGLAFIPLALYPTYCATKAGLHSYTESLRYQLKDTAVEVLEIAPPYVQTELTGKHHATDPHAMPLNDYINEVMSILKDKPNETEILVERVQMLRNSFAGGKEKYFAFFKQFNDMMFANLKK